MNAWVEQEVIRFLAAPYQGRWETGGLDSVRDPVFLSFLCLFCLCLCLCLFVPVFASFPFNLCCGLSVILLSLCHYLCLCLFVSLTYVAGGSLVPLIVS